MLSSLSRQSWRFNYYSNKVPVNDDDELLIVPGELSSCPPLVLENFSEFDC